MLAYISTDSASFGTVTEYEVFAALNPVKSYCPFIPRFANVATLDFVCCCVVELALELEPEFELLLWFELFVLALETFILFWAATFTYCPFNTAEESEVISIFIFPSLSHLNLAELE